MAEYRDELAAARMRIDTLEAKLAERDASLRARDAEILERDAELGRLRAAGNKGPRGQTAIASHLLVAFVTLTIGLGAGIMLNFSSRHIEVVSEPSPSPTEPLPVAPRPVDGTEQPAHAEGRAGEVEGSDGAKASLSEQIERARPDTEAQIRACYATERLRSPSATGFLSVTFDIDAGGSVTRVELGGILPSSQAWWSNAFATCVDKAVRAQHFRASAESSKTTAKISLHLMRPLGE